jgi:hypothetical protein
MQPYSPYLYIVLNVLYTEASFTKDILRERSEIWADQLGTIIRMFPQLFSEYDERDLTLYIDNAIDLALRDHLLCMVSDDTVQFVESFLKMCGVEFIGDPLENGAISLTPLGVSYINRIYEDRRIELLKFGRLHHISPLAEYERWDHVFQYQEPTVFYNFARKFQEGINKSHLWEDQTEYLISENESGLKKALGENIEYCSQCGDFFSVNSWATQWWDVHHKGCACPTSASSSCACPIFLK